MSVHWANNVTFLFPTYLDGFENSLPCSFTGEGLRGDGGRCGGCEACRSKAWGKWDWRFYVILRCWSWWCQFTSGQHVLGTVTPRAASAKDPELDRVEEEGEEEGGEEGEREEEKQREEEEKARRAKEDLNSLSDLDELLFCRSVNQVKV